MFAALFALACAGADSGEVHHARPGGSEAMGGDSESAGRDSAVIQTPCPPGMALVATTCMDTYEAPGQAGDLPLVMFTFLEAEAWCAAREKRLCTDAEWQWACEGGEGRAYPYGSEHQPGACNDEETWRTYDQSELNRWPSSASTPEIDSLSALWAAAGGAADHVASLYQAEGSGDSADCVNDFGVYDLVGNVEEWTTRADGGEPDFHGALKGRYWAESRTCSSTVTTHGDGFRFYEIGFRCCQDAM